MDGGARTARRGGAVPLSADALFATPLVSARLDPAVDLAALHAAILTRRAAHPGVDRSNYGGWDSDKGLFDWGGAAARALAVQLIGLADGHVYDPGRRHEWVLEGWANVSGTGDSRAVHLHPASFWSAVLFVAADGEGGELVLHDPRLPGLAMHAPALRFSDKAPEHEARIRPDPGVIVMFPAWLQHSVAPWRGPGPRVSVAVNLSARLRS